MVAALVNHLWQSTLIAGLAWLVTLALRRERARIRCAVWNAASLKFLVPFAALTAIGGRFGWRPVVLASFTQREVLFDAGASRFPDGAIRAAAHQSAPIAAVRSLVTFLPEALLFMWALGAVALLAVWAVRYFRVASIARQSTPLAAGPAVEALRKRGSLIPVLGSSRAIEPGVFGLISPTLIWPLKLEEHLSPDQIEAIVSHEVTHVAHRDNLWALGHLVTQAAFWFHPLVWWIGARVIDERERACDEAVLDAGSARESYAEGILKTCRLFTESPIACVSGVTGADLKKRIENIMTTDVRSNLNAWKKCLLAVAGSAALAVPFAIGVATVRPVNAQQPPAPNPNAAFDVTSVKANTSGSGMIRMMPAANGGFQAENVSLGMLLRMANQLQDNQIVGGPKWLFEDRYDIVGSGTAPGRDGSPFDKMKTLLKDRFKLATHMETREQNMYALVLARPDGKLGPSLTTSEADCSPGPGRGRGGAAPPAPGERPRCGVSIGPGRLRVGGQTMTAVATNLSRFVGGIVVDKTGLTGSYDFDLSYAPDPAISSFGRDLPAQPGAPPPVANSDAPSIFVAVQEQLGLKLEATKGQVNVLVVDSAEKPTPD